MLGRWPLAPSVPAHPRRESLALPGGPLRPADEKSARLMAPLPALSPAFGNRLAYTDCPYWNLLLSSNGGSDGKESSCNAGDLGWAPGWEDPLRKGMATHSSILAWRIPWTEEPGGLQSMRLQRVRQE